MMMLTHQEWLAMIERGIHPDSVKKEEATPGASRR
jgi:hypothetical protein